LKLIVKQFISGFDEHLELNSLTPRTQLTYNWLVHRAAIVSRYSQ